MDDESSLPEVAAIISAYPNDDGMYHLPAGKDRWRVLVRGRDDIRGVLGEVAVRKSGISMFFNDEQGKNSVSFLKHYFHCECRAGRADQQSVSEHVDAA